MSTQGTGTFEVKSWDEKTYHELEGAGKLTRASVRKSYEGEVEGEGILEYLMAYRDDGTATFVGLERVVGRLGGRPGSFVLQHAGSFEGGTSRVTWFVLPGSGTGDLRGLRGEGGFAAGPQQKYLMTIDYDFD
jgi:hypothetical protein